MRLPSEDGVHQSIEMWGGVECSHVRVGERVVDQLSRNGHDHRADDLERFAALGIRALRVPVLWERHHERADWTVSDRRLQRLRELGIRPIVGLLHHGSGPQHEGLLNPGFIDGLAAFARRVAERYPWVDAYTPVNEPATTARFSGLYGIWYPHGRSMATFARCFFNECAGTRAAMKAIRAINPHAQLVQTEDVGKTHSTPLLAYQAAFENERRWLTFDLLCGQLTPERRIVRDYLLAAGLSAAELDSFLDDPCPPDVLGMNHYVTSERFLDERLERYPARTHGGNGRHAYADVSAVRVRAEGPVGPAALMRELWERFRRPIAVTEVQLACTREEQVRWLLEIWRAAHEARRSGADIRAVTPWALLGSFDWNSLLTEARGDYENGAFDVRGPQPRPTLIARAIRALAQTGTFSHPSLAEPGWWRRPVRLAYPPVESPETGPGIAVNSSPTPLTRSPLVITGASGTLGAAMLRLCELRGLPAVGLRRTDLDITDAAAVRRTLGGLNPWAVINCAGYVSVDDAEADEPTCRAQNTDGAAHLATASLEMGARFVTFSSDLVFDGSKAAPYTETDPAAPLNVYGRSKLEAERRVAEINPAALLVRTSAFFGPWDEGNFATLALRDLAAGRRVIAAADFTISPTYVPDLVNATLDLALDHEEGVWHVANRGYVTWFEWARVLAAMAGFAEDAVEPAAPRELGWVAQRPTFSALASARGTLLGPWERALEQFLNAAPDWRAAVAA